MYVFPEFHYKSPSPASNLIDFLHISSPAIRTRHRHESVSFLLSIEIRVLFSFVFFLKIYLTSRDHQNHRNQINIPHPQTKTQGFSSPKVFGHPMGRTHPHPHTSQILAFHLPLKRLVHSYAKPVKINKHCQPLIVFGLHPLPPSIFCCIVLVPHLVFSSCWLMVSHVYSPVQVSCISLIQRGKGGM